MTLALGHHCPPLRRYYLLSPSYGAHILARDWVLSHVSPMSKDRIRPIGDSPLSAKL